MILESFNRLSYTTPVLYNLLEVTKTGEQVNTRETWDPENERAPGRKETMMTTGLRQGSHLLGAGAQKTSAGRNGGRKRLSSYIPDVLNLAKTSIERVYRGDAEPGENL